MFTKLLLIKLKNRCSKQITGQKISSEQFNEYLKKFSRLPEHEQHRIVQSFTRVDINGTNTIEFSELALALSQFKALDLKFEETVKFLVNLVNRKNDGAVTLDEYKVLMTIAIYGGERSADSFTEVFKMIDRDGSGEVSLAELSAWFKTLGIVLSEDNIAQILFETFRIVKQGLDQELFVKWMLNMEHAAMKNHSEH